MAGDQPRDRSASGHPVSQLPRRITMRRLIALAVAAAAALSLSVAEAGDCCNTAPKCCAPAPKCEVTCAPAPKCAPVACAPKCAPAPRCCASSGLQLPKLNLDIFGLFSSNNCCRPVATCSGGSAHAAESEAAPPAVEDAPAPPKAPYEDKAPAPAPPKSDKPAPAPKEDKAPAPKAAA